VILSAICASHLLIRRDLRACSRSAGMAL